MLEKQIMQDNFKPTCCKVADGHVLYFPLCLKVYSKSQQSTSIFTSSQLQQRIYLLALSASCPSVPWQVHHLVSWCLSLVQADPGPTHTHHPGDAGSITNIPSYTHTNTFCLRGLLPTQGQSGDTSSWAKWSTSASERSRKKGEMAGWIEWMWKRAAIWLWGGQSHSSEAWKRL